MISLTSVTFQIILTILLSLRQDSQFEKIFVRLNCLSRFQTDSNKLQQITGDPDDGCLYPFQ
jgi:hypothetical protein